MGFERPSFESENNPELTKKEMKQKMLDASLEIDRIFKYVANLPDRRFNNGLNSSVKDIADFLTKYELFITRIYELALLDVADISESAFDEFNQRCDVFKRAVIENFLSEED